MEDKYYKLRVQTGPDKNVNGHTLYYESLDDLLRAAFDCGVKGFPILGESEEITKEEYEQNYLPF